MARIKKDGQDGSVLILTIPNERKVFGIGFFNDFKRLGSKIKFTFQILGASLAFFGGARIGTAFWSIGLSGCTICGYGSEASDAGGVSVSRVCGGVGVRVAHLD